MRERYAVQTSDAYRQGLFHMCFTETETMAEQVSHETRQCRVSYVSYVSCLALIRQMSALKPS